MPLTADLQFNALTPGATLKEITVTASNLVAASADGVSVGIGAAVAADLFSQESITGYVTDARDFLLNELVSLKSDAGDGFPIAVSVAADGAITRVDDGLFRFKVGANIADPSRSHTIDAMFKLCLAKLLEAGKTGTA